MWSMSCRSKKSVWSRSNFFIVAILHGKNRCTEACIFDPKPNTAHEGPLKSDCGPSKALHIPIYAVQFYLLDDPWAVDEKKKYILKTENVPKYAFFWMNFVFFFLLKKNPIIIMEKIYFFLVEKSTVNLTFCYYRKFGNVSG